MQTQLVVLNVFRLFTSTEVLAERTERRRISLDDGHKDNQLIWPHVEVTKSEINLDGHAQVNITFSHFYHANSNWNYSNLHVLIVSYD